MMQDWRQRMNPQENMSYKTRATNRQGRFVTEYQPDAMQQQINQLQDITQAVGFTSQHLLVNQTFITEKSASLQRLNSSNEKRILTNQQKKRQYLKKEKEIQEFHRDKSPKKSELRRLNEQLANRRAEYNYWKDRLSRPKKSKKKYSETRSTSFYKEESRYYNPSTPVYCHCQPQVMWMPYCCCQHPPQNMPTTPKSSTQHFSQQFGPPPSNIHNRNYAHQEQNKIRSGDQRRSNLSNQSQYSFGNYLNPPSRSSPTNQSRTNSTVNIVTGSSFSDNVFQDDLVHLPKQRKSAYDPSSGLYNIAEEVYGGRRVQNSGGLERHPTPLGNQHVFRSALPPQIPQLPQIPGPLLSKMPSWPSTEEIKSQLDIKLSQHLQSERRRGRRHSIVQGRQTGRADSSRTIRYLHQEEERQNPSGMENNRNVSGMTCQANSSFYSCKIPAQISSNSITRNKNTVNESQILSGLHREQEGYETQISSPIKKDEKETARSSGVQNNSKKQNKNQQNA